MGLLNIREGLKFSPMMRVSLLLTASIITAKYSYDTIGVSAWLFLTFISILLALFTRKYVFSSCVALYLCIFCLGATYTARQIDAHLAPVHYISNQDLSATDKAKIQAVYLREKLESEMQQLHIENQDLAVISAMALGDKSALDKETKDHYSRSGASHILAVSGLHIGIIFQLILILLGGRRRRLITISLSTAAVWMYVLFIGMPASAVRSAVMITCYGFVQLSYRKGSPINTLAFTYVLMLFANPLSLFDLSFQMSFLAVFSILLIFPSLYKVWSPRHQISQWVWGLLSVSLAAQIGTTPLIAYYFGRISYYSILTSLVAIPAATAILYLCVLILLLYFLCSIPLIGMMAEILVHATANVLATITQTANTAFQLTAMLPGACIENIHINLPQLFFIYLSLIMGYLLCRRSSHSIHTLHLLEKVIHRN